MFKSNPDATRYSAERYNALISVEDNHRRRLEVEDRFDQLHLQACRLVEGTPLSVDLGLYLLHRHWACGPTDVMCESRGTWQGHPALVTRATSRSDYHVPTRWLATDENSVEALEFSDDAGGQRIVNRVLQHGDLFMKVLCAIRAAHLEDIVGLSILRHDALSLREGERLIEENFSGMSVVVARVPTMEEEGTLIPTTWVLDIHAGCKPACKCKPYSINECRHHAKVHEYRVCIPACVQVETPPRPERAAQQGVAG